ncbi:hypothetical protein BsWGS_17228 [Bradybaena similaris]
MMIPVFVVELLLLRGVLGNIPNACPASPDANATLCRLHECVAIADELLETMNSSRDPCQNFYQYACGGWLDQQFLNPQRTRVTTFASDLPLALTRKLFAEAATLSDLPTVRKAKNLYESCIHFKDRTPHHYTAVVEALVERFSLWPLVCDLCDGATFWLQASLKEAFILGVHLLFTLRADPSSFTDPENRMQRSKIYVGKPVLGMPFDRYEIFFLHESYRKIYAAKIVKEAEKFRSFNRTKATQDALEIVDVEVKLAMLYNSLTTKGETRIMTLQQLTTEYGQLINWSHFVSDLASSPEIGITDITSEESVIVSDPEYLRRMVEYFTGLPRRIQANYFYWRIIDSLQYVLIEDHRKLKYFLSEVTRLLSPYPYTELDCVKYVSEVFDLVVHRFLYTALTTDSTDTVGRIIRRMKSQFRNDVMELNWMGKDVKWDVIRKVNKIQTIFSFHENSMNVAVLESYFSDITVNNTDFMANVIQARRSAFVRDFKNIRRTREADPTALPHQFLAEYSRRLDKLYLSPIVLHHPFYNNINYWSLVFAGFGSVVAQEIMRGLHTTRYWFHRSIVRLFRRNTQCLVNQYNSFYYNITYRNVDGALTLDSNIADVSGLKLAYRAYKAWAASLTPIVRLPGLTLSDEQMFFVKFAQMRCTKESYLDARSTLSGKQSPDEFRVNGPLMNLPEFARAFNCPADSFMNPPNKCVVW